VLIIKSALFPYFEVYWQIQKYTNLDCGLFSYFHLFFFIKGLSINIQEEDSKTEHQSELSRRDAVHSEETMKLKNRIAWQNLIIESLGFLLLRTSEIFRKAVHSIIRLARDYYKPRFDTEQVADIKGALNLFGEDKQSHRAVGDFLYFTAKRKGDFDSRQQIKARREVDNILEGHYDQQQKMGRSMGR